MSRGYLAVMAFLFITLIVLVVVWWYARRVKSELDDPKIVAGARGVFEIAPRSVEELRRLSPEPVLLKQSEEGIRVQIEHRPMMPLMAFVGHDVTSALSEAAGAVSERYGVSWVVLVTPQDDSHVAVQRLA